MTKEDRESLEKALEPVVSSLVEEVFRTSDQRRLRLATICGVAESGKFEKCSLHHLTSLDSCVYLADFNICTNNTAGKGTSDVKA